jgi:hypothetical protein
MQKQEIDLMVENFFKPQPEQVKDFLSLDDLISIINEVKTTIPSLVLEATPRRELGSGFGGSSLQQNVGDKGGTFDLASIPEISVSELGWASLKTTDSGEKISSPQRAQLEQYLTNIEGSTFTEKIQSISSLFSMTEEELQQSTFLSAESNAGKIQKTLAYLVFLKTLTTIITNFNAASAGFSFEAFLGVLLGGGQQATGGGTIADLYDSAGTPISLKLYAEDGLEVAGSFTDLVGDMIKPKTSVELMRYIVVTKTLSGKGLEAEGLIKFYQFDIDLNNIFDVMMLSENKELIRLPQSFLQNPEGSDFVSLKRTTKKAEVPQEEIDKVFYDGLSTQIGDDYANIIMTAIKNESDSLPIFDAKEEELKKIGTPFNKSFSNDMINIIQARTKEQLTPDRAKNIENAIKLAFKTAKEYRDKTGVSLAGKKRETDLKQLAFASPEDSYSAYQAYPPQVKKKALLNSYGYLYTEQFAMTRNQVFSVMQGKKMKRGGTASEPIGTIKIGSKNLQAIMTKLAANLNDSIFEIFSNLSVLTRSINSYFATGLRDQTAADSAQQAAQNIDKKTAEIKQAR